MSGSAQPSETMSPVGRLHESLIAHRRVFLEAAVAEVYASLREPQDDGTYLEVWAAWPESLDELNKTADVWNEEASDEERFETHTAETFAQHVLHGFGYEGMSWDRSGTCFDQMFPGDEQEKSIVTRWRIGSRALAARLNESAMLVGQTVSPDLLRVREIGAKEDGDELEQRLATAIWGDAPQWTTVRVRWTYLRDLDSVIRDVHRMALAAGDGPFLTDFTRDPRRTLVVDVREYAIVLGEHRREIGDTQPFHLLYTLARRPGEWISNEELKDQANTGDVKQIMYALRNDLKHDPSWQKIADAIESRRGAYRLLWPDGVQMVPPA